MILVYKDYEKLLDYSKGFPIDRMNPFEIEQDKYVVVRLQDIQKLEGIIRFSTNKKGGGSVTGANWISLGTRIPWRISEEGQYRLYLHVKAPVAFPDICKVHVIPSHYLNRFGISFEGVEIVDGYICVIANIHRRIEIEQYFPVGHLYVESETENIKADVDLLLQKRKVEKEVLEETEKTSEDSVLAGISASTEVHNNEEEIDPYSKV